MSGVFPAPGAGASVQAAALVTSYVKLPFVGKMAGNFTDIITALLQILLRLLYAFFALVAVTGEIQCSDIYIELEAYGKAAKILEKGRKALKSSGQRRSPPRP